MIALPPVMEAHALPQSLPPMASIVQVRSRRESSSHMHERRMEVLVWLVYLRCEAIFVRKASVALCSARWQESCCGIEAASKIHPPSMARVVVFMEGLF